MNNKTLRSILMGMLGLLMLVLIAGIILTIMSRRDSATEADGVTEPSAVADVATATSASSVQAVPPHSRNGR